MNRQELRVELEWFCGCGQPEAAAMALLRLLRFHPLYESREAFKEFVPDDGVEHLLLYMLADRDLAEHGGSVGGGWLTEKGKAVMEALAREEGDQMESLCGQYCVHGFDIDDDSHDCFAADNREPRA